MEVGYIWPGPYYYTEDTFYKHELIDEQFITFWIPMIAKGIPSIMKPDKHGEWRWFSTTGLPPDCWFGIEEAVEHHFLCHPGLALNASQTK